MATSPKQEEEDEELEDMPEEKKARDPLRHARIKRVIDSRTFTGYVEDIEVGKVSGDILYRVRYSDGDVEHFTANMVREMQDLERDSPQTKVLPKKPAMSPPVGEVTETAEAAEGGGTPGKNPPEAADMDVGEGEEEEQQEGEEEEQPQAEEEEEEERQEVEEEAVTKKPAAATEEANRRPAGMQKKPATAAAEEAEMEDVSKKPAAAMDDEEELVDEGDEAVELEEEGEEENVEEEDAEEEGTVLKKPAAKTPVQKEIAKVQAKTAARAKGVFKRPAAK